jgi:Holliday junction resolvase RusA-like endonuclease
LERLRAGEAEARQGEEYGKMTDTTKKYLDKLIKAKKLRRATLLVTSSAEDGCFEAYLSGKDVCRECKHASEKYFKSDVYAEEFFSQLDTYFGQTGSFSGGYKFQLPVPPKSFRALEKNRDLKKAYRIIIKEIMAEKRFSKYDGEVLLHIVAYLKGYYAKTDCDNLAKGVQDALQELLFDNDSQVKYLVVEKHKVSSRNLEKMLVRIMNIH